MNLPPLDVRMVTAFELQADVQLPPSLLQVLTEQNGGDLRYDALPCPDRGRFPDGFLRIPHLRGVGVTAGMLPAGSLGVPYEVPERLIVLCAQDDGLLGLDYTNAPNPLNPPVVWVDEQGTCELAQDFEIFVRSLTRSDEDFLVVLLPLEDDDTDVADAFLDHLEEVAPDFEEVSAKDDTWLLHHARWTSRTNSEQPASIMLRAIDTANTGDPEFPEVPQAQWAVELDLKPDNVRWLEQCFQNGPVRLIRVHTPVV